VIFPSDALVALSSYASAILSNVNVLKFLVAKSVLRRWLYYSLTVFCFYALTPKRKSNSVYPVTVISFASVRPNLSVNGACYK
jgi:hypothetical protein